MACEKCQGIQKGGLVRLGVIEVVHVTRVPLGSMLFTSDGGKREAVREGFPDMTGAEFVEMFCQKMKCKPSDAVTRIEFKRIEEGGRS